MLGGGQNAFATEANAQNVSDVSVNQGAILSANHNAIDSGDSTNQSALDSKRNIKQYIILAQNNNATNQNATDSSDSTNDSIESNADSTAPKLSTVYDLGRIERTVATSPDSNSTVSIVTSEDIANNGAQNVAEALRHTQGIFMQPASGSRGEPTIGIRGYSTIHIGLFVDGIPVHSIYDRQTDWAQFSSFGVSEISVSKGYTSPLYGANTLGGSVNVVTSKPLDKLEIYGGYTFISNNEHRLKAQVGSNLGQWYFQVGYDFTDRKSLNLSSRFKPTQVQPNTTKIGSNYTNHTLRAKVGFEPNENHEYSLNLIYQKGEKGGMIGASGTSQNLWEWPQYDKITLYVLGNSRFNDMISLNTKLYYDSFYNILKVMGAWNGSSIQQTNWAQSSISPDKPYTSTYDDYSLGLIETVDFAFGDNIDFKFGVNLKQDTHRNTNERTTTSNGFVKEKDDQRDISTSIFAEYAQRISWFRFALNGSYDRNDMLKVIKSNASDKKYSLQGWTLQGILYFDINDYWTIYLNAGKKSKIPTLKDRYSTTWGNRVPNPNIAPESAINYEIGTTFNWEATKFSFAAFYNDIREMLISVSATGCISGNNCYKLENAKEGYSYGVEVGVNQGFWEDKINLGLNYTFTERKTTNKKGSSYGVDGSRILDYPNHILNFSFMTTPVRFFDIIAYLTYQSPQWYGIGGGRNQPNTSYGKNGHIWLVDLKVNLRPIESVPDFQLSLGAYNLFDKNYYYGSDYYQAGRRILLGVEYRY